MANKAVKYRIYPTPEQKRKIAQTFGCCRKVWNLMLEVRRNTGVQTRPAMYKSEHPYLKDVDSLALCNEQMNMQQAFKNHLENPAHFGEPKFKSKKNPKASYTTSMVNGNIKLLPKSIALPKLGEVKCRVHRKVPEHAKVKSVTVSRNGAGRFFASVLYEYDFAKPAPVKVETSIGLDYSSPEFYVDSDGVAAEHPKPYREMEGKLARAQHVLSRMVKGSNNYRKQLRKIGRMHQRMADIRRDWIEKRTTEISNRYDLVGLESLDMHAQAQSLRFGKAVHDNGYGMFCRRLECKMSERGKHVVYIDRWFPSSRLCRNCGEVFAGLKLGQSEWECPSCHEKHERDPYAAETIRLEALRIYREEAA